MAKIIDGKPYSWTQPMCLRCWSEMYPGRQAATLKQPNTETCCRCGTDTIEGLYIRIDPAECRFPTPEEE